MEPDGPQDGRPVIGQPPAPAHHPPSEVGQAIERVVGDRLTDQRPERLDRRQLRGAWRQEVNRTLGGTASRFAVGHPALSTASTSTFF